MTVPEISTSPASQGQIPPLRLAIQTLLLPGMTLREQFEAAATAGFDGVEVAVGPRFDLRDRLGELQAAMAATGTPVAAICTHPIHDPLHHSPRIQRQRLAGLADLLALADTLGAAGVVCVPIRPGSAFPGDDPGSDDAERATEPMTIEGAAAILHEWAATLPAGTSRVFLEPLNRYEANLLNRVEQAVALARLVDHPRVVALADLFHMNIEESDLGQPILKANERLGYVHIADNNRLEPGAGCLDFVTPLRALQRIGYTGWVSIECFSPSGPRLSGPPDAALPATVAFLRDTWRRAAHPG